MGVDVGQLLEEGEVGVDVEQLLEEELGLEGKRAEVSVRQSRSSFFQNVAH